MLFNSIDFAIFLPVIFLLYWCAVGNKVRQQNLLLVISSYIFYGWWDWRFCSLILLSTIADFLIARSIQNEEHKSRRKTLLFLSFSFNIGILAFFKYYNFFLDNFISAFKVFGTEFEPTSLNIILPVGISFYTFQTLSYTIDVYRKKINATNDFVSFLAYVSFFPQLVAGPIERATNLLPQFQNKRRFEYYSGVNGFTQIIWGLFKKLVIADNCALIVNQVFTDYDQYSGSTLVLGAILFAFQIYADFSGYSDIAIGTAKLFGFNLQKNFDFPYFSRDIAEFWRRWHISLSSWFKDYLYIPMGGSRGTKRHTIRNVFVIFLISGLWHGANWTFIIWGFIHSILFLPLLIGKRNRNNLDQVASNSILPSGSELVQMLSTFLLVTLAWVFFRSENITSAIEYIQIIFSKSFLSVPYVFGIGKIKALLCLTMICVLLLIEWFGRKKDVPIYFSDTKKINIQWIVSIVFSISILLFKGQHHDHIYFQF